MDAEQWDYPGARAMEAARQALAPGLRCAACGKPVAREGAHLVRSCTCTAPVIADIAARMAGSGGLR